MLFVSPVKAGFAALFLVPALLGTQAIAQATPAETSSFSAHVDVTVAEVEVFVADRDGRPVPDLTAADFRVVEDGQAAEVTGLAAGTSQRLNLAIFFDQTTLDVNARATALAALRRFFDAGLRPGDRVLLAAWDGSLEVRAEPSGDPAVLRAALDKLGAAPPPRVRSPPGGGAARGARQARRGASLRRAIRSGEERRAAGDPGRQPAGRREGERPRAVPGHGSPQQPAGLRPYPGGGSPRHFRRPPADARPAGRAAGAQGPPLRRRRAAAPARRGPLHRLAGTLRDHGLRARLLAHRGLALQRGTAGAGGGEPRQRRRHPPVRPRPAYRWSRRPRRGRGLRPGPAYARPGHRRPGDRRRGQSRLVP